jgi:cobalt-zinc-cadmium resistance protein CzcA
MSQEEMDAEVFQSASKIRNSAAFGEIIILIVYIPILTLIGIEGKMFRPMAQTVGFAIFGALLLSLTYIPMMCAWVLPRQYQQKQTFSDRMMAFFHRLYAPLLELAIRFKTVVISITVLIFLVSLFVFNRLGGEFIPTLQEGDYAFHCILPQGASLSQSLETSMQASRRIKQFDEVRMVVGKTGSAEVPTDPMPPEATDMIIVLKPQDEWKRDITYDQLADEIMDSLAVLPGIFFEKSQPIQMRFNELMTGIRQDVAVKIFGENMDTLSAYAQQVSGLLRDIPGVTEPAVERVEGLPQIVIRYDRNRLAGYGLNIEDINQVISTSFAGGHAGEVFENERRFDLVIRLDSSRRREINDVSQLYIPTKDGAQIPLSQIADVRFELGPAQISREDGKRRIVIGFNVEDRDVKSVVTDIRERLDQQINLPEGYYFSFGGTFENLEAASRRLMIAVPIALALIFILLYFTFNALQQAALIFTAIPMGAIGGVFALVLRDMPFSISAGVGFIALFGVCVLNGIVLISTFNTLEKEGMTNPLQRIREGTYIRLRPVLMTATVASLGFLPMALSHGAGAEVQKPLATVVIGGLITSTALTLFVLPLLYLLFSKPVKMNTSIKLAGICLFMICSIRAGSQTSIRSLHADEAIEIALQHNLQLQSHGYNIASSKAMTDLGYELPATDIGFQYGQFNSKQNDNYFNIEQSIPMPAYYKARSALYDAELKHNELLYQETELEIIKTIRQIFDQVYFILYAKKELEALDGFYVDLVKVSALRYATGETNLVEKNAAELKLGEIRMSIARYQSNLQAAYASLKMWMNASEDFIIEAPEDYMPLEIDFPYDTALIANHPALLALQQEVIMTGAETHMQRKSTMPELKAGYFNQSIIGLQNVNGSDVYYDGQTRFQGFNLGLSIPLLWTGNKTKIESLEAKQMAKQSEASFSRSKFQTELITAFQQYYTYKSEYDYYQSTALHYADQLLNSANTGYRSGDIGYLEYIIALQYVANTHIQYLERIHQVNQQVIHIQYLTKQ